MGGKWGKGWCNLFLYIEKGVMNWRHINVKSFEIQKGIRFQGWV